MKKVRLFLLAGLMAAATTHAATLTENFSSNPLADGWQMFGDTNLFQWDCTNQNLDVTWDSTQVNSYFYHPLDTVLMSNENFSVAFDMELNEAEAYNYGFQLSVGLFNLAEATNAAFQRSTSYNSPDLVEFDYFPDVGYGPTTWPVMVDFTSGFNWNGPSDYAIYAPNLNDWYHIVMTYTASNQTLMTTMTNFEQTSGIAITDPIGLTFDGTPFANFRVDAISISSYQDDGFGDSIYAQGVIDNIVVTLPPAPIRNLTGAFTNGVWQAQFCSLCNWTYALVRTTNFQCWTTVSPSLPGNGTNLILQDTNPPACQAFYSVNASNP